MKKTKRTGKGSPPQPALCDPSRAGDFVLAWLADAASFACAPASRRSPPGTVSRYLGHASTPSSYKARRSDLFAATRIIENSALKALDLLAARIHGGDSDPSAKLGGDADFHEFFFTRPPGRRGTESWGVAKETRKCEVVPERPVGEVPPRCQPINI